jgi:2-polyprenyl-3-methyl-5-hydroxy-6-metoxy-1,4-benzoquinol methylase
MNRFTQRSSQTELIDEPGIPFDDWEVCLHELNAVNTYLGGHKTTIHGVKSLFNNKFPNSEIVICEIGCGGGDNLKAISKYFSKGNTSPKFIGIDINKACTDFAANNCKYINSRFICSDYRDVVFDKRRPDIIFNSLFCHHFTNEQLVLMLKWMKHNSSGGFFINDLQRHPFAYHAIKTLTKIFSRSYLVKNDGPVSVLRGFHKREWIQLLEQAGIKNYSIRWRWAFRYIIVVKNE